MKKTKKSQKANEKTIKKDQRNKQMANNYSQKVLGYRTERSKQFKLIDSSKRMAILYDHVYHNKTVRDLIKEHETNYSTIRHILA